MSTAGANPNPTAPPTHVAPPTDQEEVYYDGSPPVAARGGRAMLFNLAALILIVLGVMLIAKHDGPFWIGLIVILLGCTLPPIPVLLAKSVRYRISNYRIDFERGLIAKNIDTLELWHVEDLHFHQTIFDRMFNIGDITVISQDQTMPTLDLRGIPNPRPIFDTLKARVIAVKRQRGVIKMDPG